MLTESSLHQRVFDALFHSAAMLFFMQPDEIEEIARSLENPANVGNIIDQRLMNAFAAAVRVGKTVMEDEDGK